MNQELIGALDDLEASKGVSKEVILDALEKALEKSYEKNFNDHTNVEVHVDRENGEIHVFSVKVVKEEVEDPLREISLEEARQKDVDYELGDEVRIEVNPENFGRVAAQTARNIIIQKLHDAERQNIYDEYIGKVREVITCTVQRADLHNVYINLGRAEGFVPYREQIPGENLKQGDRVKLYVLDVRNNAKGAQILLSRAHPELVTRLFEQEVPEIADGIVEIYSVAREAGSRSKVAVYSNDPDVDPIGACVGYKGSRVNVIVDELHGEKMDITIYDPDPKVFISNALSPAMVNNVITNVPEKSSYVIVPDDQLSLAIGREGQNVRLAARLTGWKIDIKGESEYLKDPSFYDAAEISGDQKAEKLEENEEEENLDLIEDEEVDEDLEDAEENEKENLNENTEELEEEEELNLSEDEEVDGDEEELEIENLAEDTEETENIEEENEDTEEIEDEEIASQDEAEDLEA